MRLNVASLRRMVKGKLHVQFVRQDLTSYSGLELLRRYLRQLDLPRRLRAACAATGGDYGGGRLALLILALFYVGALRPQWFSVSHVFIWQSLVIVFGVVLWLVWVRGYALADARG